MLYQSSHFCKLVLVAIALHSDPAVVNPHQPMRLPGFYRKEKADATPRRRKTQGKRTKQGRHQALSFYCHDNVQYTLDQFEAGLKQFYSYKGWIYPEVLSGQQ